MTNQWPWSWEEEEAWAQEKFIWIEELIDHINDGLAAACPYDPLQPEDVLTEDPG